MRVVKRLHTITLFILALMLASTVPQAAFADTTETSSETTQSTQTEGVKSTEPPTLETESTTETSTTISTETTVESGTGTADVTHNDTAGSATSGQATATATQVTTINSAVSTGPTGGFSAFTKDIDGDVVGDITLDELILAAIQQSVQPGSNAASVQNTHSIQNTITASATSGDAIVAYNGEAGNAASGAAIAQVNSMTIVNSIVASQNSFTGTVNIYGSLTGDILIAPQFLAQLLADNTTPRTTIALPSGTTSTTVTNIVNLSATSGDATVAHNGEAGNATSGDASTNLVIMNLTGRQVSAGNSLIVFINVLGQWVGAIVNAPATSTAALLGSGVTQDTQYTPIPSNTTTHVTNTVTADARTGNATVAYNGQAGTAQSGAAQASANLLTIAESNLGFSGWFGVLFINVFGTWLGSFGTDTPYGNATPPPTSPSTPTMHGAAAPGTTITIFTLPILTTYSFAQFSPVESIETEDDSRGHTLAASTRTPPTAPSSNLSAPTSSPPYVLIAALVGLLTLAFFIQYLLRRVRPV